MLSRSISMRPALRPVLFFLCWVLFVSVSSGDDEAKRTFDLPAGDASETLKRFAQQAHREIMFPAEPVDGMRTNAVQGEFTVRQGLDRLLAGTPLRATEDEKTGALAIVRSPPADSATDSSAAKKK